MLAEYFKGSFSVLFGSRSVLCESRYRNVGPRLVLASARRSRYRRVVDDQDRGQTEHQEE
jgi:hypothetical protein